MKILEFLNSKPLFYAKIDYKKMPLVYAKYKQHFKLNNVIHVIGTNGKGSTGRWLSLMLMQNGLNVGHYTSPHVLAYNERFWENGSHISMAKLNECHEKLLSILSDEDANSLSYFEYSTLLCALVFEKCDYVVLEAGLGGEYDATQVYEKKLSIVTPIGYDHEDFLGYTLRSITTTKLNSITSTTIIAPQNENIILQTAIKIADKKSLKLIQIQNIEKKVANYIKKHKYASFFEANLQTAYEAAKFFGFKVNFDTLLPLDLIGRCQKIAPNITLDVGHNPLSAMQIVKNFKEKSINLIYNSYKDKDIKNILNILKPILLHVSILRLDSCSRELGENEIIKVLNELDVPWDYFTNIQKDKQYLVFGSFYVAEHFLKRIDYNER